MRKYRYRRITDGRPVFVGVVEPPGDITVVVHVVEIFEVDYDEVGLAPAIAGWAADEFGFALGLAAVRRVAGSDEFVVDWAG